ncbi:MAG: hypothetical protein V3U54_08615 [Thermodesulfobacteriota bacterium]
MTTKLKSKKRQEEYEFTTCCTCSVGFFITPEVHYREAGFHCPNGHGLINTKASEKIKAKKDAEEEAERRKVKKAKFAEIKRKAKLPNWKKLLS